VVEKGSVRRRENMARPGVERWLILPPSMGTVSSPAPPSPDAVAPERSVEDLVGSQAAGPAALRGSALRGGAYAATVALSLVSAPLLIRHLGIAGFGRYTTIVAIVTIGGGLTDVGLLFIAVREWATRAGEDRAHLMRTLLGLRLELSAAGVVLGAGFALLAGYSGALVLGTIIAGCGMVLQATASFLTVALQGELRFGWASIIDVARQAVAVLMIVALVVVGAGLLPFFAVTIPAGLVTLAFTAALVRGRMPLSPRLRGAERWPLLRDTLPFAAAIAVNTIYFRVTIVVMSVIASPQQTGYFATSFRVIEVLVGVPALAIGAAFPILSRAAREDSERFIYATERILELALIVGTGLVLVVVLSAPFVVSVLAGAHGMPAASVLQIQGLALVATFVATACGYSLLSLRDHAALLLASGGALVANVVLTLALVPLAHARGAAIAAVSAESCLAIVLLARLVRSGRTRFQLASLLAVAIAGLAGAAPLLVPGMHPLLRTVAGLGIYVAALALQQRLPPELAHALKGRQRR
jgi:O-antigen/teichoic acid export membrane protein